MRAYSFCVENNKKKKGKRSKGSLPSGISINLHDVDVTSEVKCVKMWHVDRVTQNLDLDIHVLQL